MSLTGTVISKEGNLLMVEVMPKPECNGCIACKSLLSDESTGPKRIPALQGEIEVEPGDKVILDTAPGTGSIAALIIFGFPLASFFAGLFSAPLLMEYFKYPPTDIHSIIGGFACLTASLIIIALISKAGYFMKLSLVAIRKI